MNTNSPMTSWNKAFDQVLREFNISAKQLAKESGVTEQTISQFRKGRNDATTRILNRLLESLPYDARERFFSLLLRNPVLPAKPTTIAEQVKELPRGDRKKLIVELVTEFIF